MSNGEGTAATARPTAPPIPGRLYQETSYDVDPGRGWLLFAGIMLAVVGVLNIVYGIAAVSDSKIYVRDVAFVFGNLHLWGWLLIVVGVAQVGTSIGIWRTAEWARWLGILFAIANGCVQFLVMPAHPFWAIMIFMIDVIIAYGLITYGGRDRYSLAG
jgi:hypothetical protein